jgi:hypothetical protein
MKNCEYCHKEFPERKSKRYCSTSCRVAGFFLRKAEAEYLQGLDGIETSKKLEIIETIAKAKIKKLEAL